jgi:hypothetical protein
MHVVQWCGLFSLKFHELQGAYASFTPKEPFDAFHTSIVLGEAGPTKAMLQATCKAVSLPKSAVPFVALLG